MPLFPQWLQGVIFKLFLIAWKPDSSTNFFSLTHKLSDIYFAEFRLYKNCL